MDFMWEEELVFVCHSFSIGEFFRHARKQPKHQRKEKQLLDQVIDSVGEAQPRHSMKYIDPDGGRGDNNNNG